MNPKIKAVVIIFLTIISIGIWWGSMRFAYILMGTRIFGIGIEYFLFAIFLIVVALIIKLASKDPKENMVKYRSKDDVKYKRNW